MFCLPSPARERQKDTLEVFSDEYLDTVKVRSKRKLNDYSMIGFSYGATFCNTDYNPSKHNRAWIFAPNYFSATFTHYEKLFGYLPYFGYSIGIAYGHEGGGFKDNPKTGKPYGDVNGATRFLMSVVEVPAMAQFHVDFDPMRLLACVGVYGGYRLDIDRSGPYMDKNYVNTFRDYERRWDFGLQGGAGIAFVFAPVELHINAMLRWAWSSLYEPNYNSPYYYRFAYPLDVTVTAGLHFHLSKRRGKTTSELKKQAYEYVYGKTEDTAGEDR